MKLYKFRSLADETTTERVVAILSSGQFWCSRFWDLNDPMEGVYRLQTASSCVRQVFDEKAERLICSFSGAKALMNPLMWGYYANGFKGLAIEIEVNDPRVRPIRYTDDVVCPDATQPVDRQAEAILCNKLKAWKHEQEYRFLDRGAVNLQAIGTVTAVVIGVPYPRLVARAGEGDERMRHLAAYPTKLHAVRNAATARGIDVRIARVAAAKVVVEDANAVDEWQ